MSIYEDMDLYKIKISVCVSLITNFGVCIKTADIGLTLWNYFTLQ